MIPSINSKEFQKYDPYDILDNDVFMNTFINAYIQNPKFKDNISETKVIHYLLSLLNVKGLGLYSAMYNLLANDCKRLRNEIIRMQIIKLNASLNIKMEFAYCFMLSTGLTYLRYKMIENGKSVSKSIKGVFRGLISWDINEFSNAMKADDNVRRQAMKESLMSVIVLVANYYYYFGFKNSHYVSNSMNELLSFLYEQQEKNYVTDDFFCKDFSYTLSFFNSHNLFSLFENQDSFFSDISDNFNNDETVNIIIDRFRTSSDLKYGCFI